MRYLCVITLVYINSAVTSELQNLNISQQSTHVSRVDEKWMVMPLDHFNPHERRSFKIRYYETIEYWKPRGPIYIYINGESTLLSWVEPDFDFLFIAQLAKETNGAMFATEHRYYGGSLPDIPYNDKKTYYKFLSSRQALSDVANFIMTLKLDPKYRSSKVVVIGASYSGNLAAWMRELYPNLVDAAVAISAPVLAKKDFHEYLDGVRYTFDKYGTENCLNNIEKRFKMYEELLKSKSGRELIKKTLHLDPNSDLTVLKNQQSLFTQLYSPLMYAAQFGPPSNVKEACNCYTSSSNNVELHLLKLYHLITSDVPSNFLNIHFSTSGPQNMEAWQYQLCTEFGYFRTTSSEKQPFVHWNPLDYSLTYCNGFVEGVIENRIDEAVARTNAMYGGRTPKVSKVVFTNGDMDPWHTLGVQRDLAPDAPSFIINGTAHCDLISEKPWEPKEMTEKRKYIKDLIKKWIGL